MSIVKNMLISVAVLAAPLAASAGDLQCQGKGTTTAAVDQAAGVLQVNLNGQTLVYKITQLSKTGEATEIVIGYSQDIGQHAILNVDTKSGHGVLQAAGTSADLNCVQN